MIYCSIEEKGKVFNKVYKSELEYLKETSQITGRIVPYVKPSKIVGVGLNYHDHADEMKKTPPKEPMLFLKSPSSIISHDSNILIPNHMSSKVDYEGELGIIISKEARWVSTLESHKYILGGICINDITARDLQKVDIQFGRGKNFDTFCPIGPYISDQLDFQNLTIQTYVNGIIKQNSNTSYMIHKIDFLISFISKIMTLLPGDMILTGTPGGVGQIIENDEVSVKIDGLSQTKNKVQLSF